MTNEFVYSVNIDSAVPVYIQIENQIQFAIATGRLKPGDQVPSVRVMSSTVEVNPNTVTKAYRDLELLGMVSSRRGYGIAVTEKAPKIARAYCEKIAREQLQEAVAVCVACGFTTSDVRAMVSEIISSGATPYQSVDGDGRP